MAEPKSFKQVVLDENWKKNNGKGDQSLRGQPNMDSYSFASEQKDNRM